jgi:hypothetical protein
MSEVKDTVVEKEATSPDAKEKKVFVLRHKKEPNYTGDPGRSLIDEVTKLKTAIQLMVELQGELLKKLQAQDVKLTAIARFCASQSSDHPSFGVL